ncbi:bacterial pullanase-associated domain protein [Streptococcus ictaluri 707-05]|uniref:Bacterial pullanase-associated domain protein n=1 Tax=Streptococcus ictaluri 707-05 TaxID=764299 RepID=G5JZQ8_9STRE|nr:bacterial pullanase-associated domain protein [Streptococcus ictaluri 707-05]
MWDDVAEPSKDWPKGALPLSEAQKDSYGSYLDLKLSDQKRQQLSFLINNKAGDKVVDDHHLKLLTDKMNEAWLDEDFKSYPYQPLEKGFIRINYQNDSQTYDNLAVWLFKDVKTPSTDWPNGLDLVKRGPYGAYVDVPLKEDAKEIGF